jgi:hypothetical protein
MTLEVSFVYLLGLLNSLLLRVIVLVCFNLFLHFLLEMFVLLVFFWVEIRDVL